VRIDGVPTHEYALRTIAPYLKASTPQGRDVQLFDYGLLVGAKNMEVSVEFADAKGRTFTTSLARTVPVMVRPSAQLDFRMFGGRIAYVGGTTLGDAVVVSRFDSLFARISAADALIIDLRDNGGGNSSVGWDILGRLTDRPFATERFLIREYIPTYRAWGRGERLREEPLAEWQPADSKLFTKPVVVLTSARTGSAAEDFCVAFRQMNRGKIVGESTRRTSVGRKRI